MGAQGDDFCKFHSWMGGDEGSMCAGKMCQDAVLLHQDMGVSKNSGTPKSSILIGVFHYFHHPFWGTPIFGNTHIVQKKCQDVLPNIQQYGFIDVFFLQM